MALEIGPRPKIRKISFADVLFYLVLTLLALLVVGFFVLNAWQNKLEVQLAEIKKGLEKTDAEAALEEEIFGSANKIGFQQKIQDFSGLLANHKLPVNLFNFLQENTHPRVWFQKFSLNVQQGSLSLSGFAENFEALSQQITIFRNQELIKSTNLARMSIAQEGNVGFDFQLAIDPKVFTPLEISKP